MFTKRFFKRRLKISNHVFDISKGYLIDKKIYREDFKFVNSSGKVVLNGKLKRIINTTSFNEGIYFLYILNGKKSYKIIIDFIK